MLIGTFLLYWGGEYPERVCDTGFGTPCIVAEDYYNFRVQCNVKILKLLYCKTVAEIFCIQTSCDSKISSNRIEW